MGFFQMIEAAFGLSRKSARILVIGLDNSGKSTIIDHLKPKKVNGKIETTELNTIRKMKNDSHLIYEILDQTSSTEITPTVGFQVEEFTKNSINFTVYDMSGQGRYRSLWEHYYTDVEAIIFVLDSTDRLRMCVAKEELIQLLSHEEIKKTRAPVLFFANKVSSIF
jgi:ADP-ribosylation factor-like protein 6